MNQFPMPIALAILLTSFLVCTAAYADTDRFALWDQLDADIARLSNDQLVDENEDRDFEEILGLGRSGKTEEAITALNAFSKGNRNQALREVARNTYAVLFKQQKEATDNWDKRVHDKHACTLDMMICPNGEIVGREGPGCAFSKCTEGKL